MLQLRNESPFAPAIAVFPDRAGVDTLYVIVRGSFRIGRTLSVADEQPPPVQADEYWGEPGLSSLKYASDYHIGKPSTDVVLVGHARAPQGTRVRRLDVQLAVAERRKTLRVTGDRIWQRDGSASVPEPFEAMPLVYERAYGGVHQPDPGSPEMLGEATNPIGVGFKGKRRGADLVGQPLPNIEEPGRPIRSPGDASVPAGFGFIAPNWEPRLSRAGTYDEAWQRQRAPYLPEDFDPRFLNAAHPDLVFDRYLSGGEPVEAINVHPAGPLQFTLPHVPLDIAVSIAGRSERPAAVLETVLIEPDDLLLSLVWRAAVRCDKQVLKVKEIRVGLRRLHSAGRAA